MYSTQHYSMLCLMRVVAILSKHLGLLNYTIESTTLLFKNKAAKTTKPMGKLELFSLCRQNSGLAI